MIALNVDVDFSYNFSDFPHLIFSFSPLKMNKSKLFQSNKSLSSSRRRWMTWIFFTTVFAVHLLVSFLILSEMAWFSQDISTMDYELNKSKYLYMKIKKTHKSQSHNSYTHKNNYKQISEPETESESAAPSKAQEYSSASQSTPNSKPRLKIDFKFKTRVQNSTENVLNLQNLHQKEQRTKMRESAVTSNFNLTSRWQTISIGRDSELHVYSAYYDVKLKQVLIIGGSEKKNRGKFESRMKCCFHYEDEPPGGADAGSICLVQVAAKIEEMEEQKIFSHSLGISQSEIFDSHLRLPIQYPWEQRFGWQVDLSICLKPLHSSLNQPLRFLEWLEFHRLMGVEKFTLYAQNPNPDLLCILKFYQDFGVVELLPWDIPFPVITSEDAWNRDRFNYGQSGAQNDCLYRHRGSSKFVAFIDMDEFITPQEPWKNLTGLLHDLNNDNEAGEDDLNLGAFIIQSTFFFTNWRDDDKVSAGKFGEMAGFQDLNAEEKDLSSKLITVRKTKRKTQTYPHGSWSKPICTPDGVREVGVHIVHELAEGYKKLHVPSAKTVLHHYRNCDRFLGGESLTSRYLVNPRMHTFAPDLVQKMSGKIKLLQNACPSIKFE